MHLPRCESGVDNRSQVLGAVKAQHKPTFQESIMAASCRPRILIADDHTLVAELCQKLLEGQFDVVVS
jgi:hypothetical protein